jgi:serine O-acetyltransferase
MGPQTVTDDNIAAALVQKSHAAPQSPPQSAPPSHPIDDHLGETNQNPIGMGLLELLREDLRTHERDFFSQGFWAISVHRFGNWRMDIRPKLLRAPFSLLYRFLYKFVEWTCGISLNYPVRVGRRVRIWHHGGMILGARSIGDDVHIRQNTTFGVARRGDHRSLKPIIEDRADIGAGAVIVGPITIGHDSQIGANAVVLKDVPPLSVAVGVPAKVIKTLDPQAPVSSLVPRGEVDGDLANKAVASQAPVPSPRTRGEG